MRSRVHLIGWSLLLLSLSLPLIPYALAYLESQAATVPHPGTGLWRELRHAIEGITQVEGVDAGVLIDDAGEQWRRYRMEWLAPYGAIVLSGMVGIFVLYYLIKGKIRIEQGRSGQRIRRYTGPEMVVHWILATTFVILTLSGLILLYGRWVLIPLLGPEGFSATAAASKIVHNYVGLLFAAIVPIAFFLYLKDSLFNLKVDGQWLRRAGGYFGGKEPSSEKVNAGQKFWYWVAMLGGFVLIGSGLVLDFPNFQQGRAWLQYAHVIHTIAAIGVTAFFTVHLYLATVGVEGALESMIDGHVDANWAKQHHDLWYERVKHQAAVGAAEEQRTPSVTSAGDSGQPATER